MICDDQKMAVDKLKDLVSTVCKELNMHCEISTCFSGEKLLKIEKAFDIYFLDIDMPGIDGIEVGRQISSKWEGCKLIMATGMIDRYKDAFKIRAHRYVTKPFQVEEIREALENIGSRRLGTELIELSYKRVTYKFPQKDISFVRAINGYTEFWVSGKWFRKNISFKQAIALLDEQLFVVVNKSEIVNLRFVEEQKDKVVYVGEKVFKISRRNKLRFDAKYLEFDLKYR
ncbi:MAG: LytTR family DNA-binding domain-containing protein [Acetatifactor sp.]|nr:LytTR family DNA-binding domain-containing protein [Acetatifactor sp.]